MQPTFGYLIGFALAVFIIDFIIERVDSPTKIHFIDANIVGLIITYAVAVPYLYLSLNFWLHMKTSWSHIFVVGFLNSIVADFCLAIASALLAERLYKVFQSVRTVKIMQVEREDV